jgi:hypothetical protein
MVPPKDLIVGSVKVYKTENVQLLRQHVMLEFQEDGPTQASQMVAAFQQNRATGEIKIEFNQGGIRSIFAQQITKETITPRDARRG